jgi:hypothetical protein
MEKAGRFRCNLREGCVGADDAKVDKSKFDALLKAMLSTAPLPRSEVRVKKRKPRKFDEPRQD